MLMGYRHLSKHHEIGGEKNTLPTTASIAKFVQFATTPNTIKSQVLLQVSTTTIAKFLQFAGKKRHLPQQNPTSCK
jgi:hypothetical protein